MSDGSGWVAITGLVLAIISLLWQVWNEIRRPQSESKVGRFTRRDLRQENALLDLKRGAATLAGNCEGFVAAADNGDRSSMQQLLPQGVQQGLRKFRGWLATSEEDIYDHGVREAIDSLDDSATDLVETADAIDLVGLRDAVQLLSAWARRVEAEASDALKP